MKCKLSDEVNLLVIIVMGVISLFESERVRTTGMVIAVTSRESKPSAARKDGRQGQLFPNKPD